MKYNRKKIDYQFPEKKKKIASKIIFIMYNIVSAIMINAFYV